MSALKGTVASGTRGRHAMLHTRWERTCVCVCGGGGGVEFFFRIAFSPVNGTQKYNSLGSELV